MQVGFVYPEHLPLVGGSQLTAEVIGAEEEYDIAVFAVLLRPLLNTAQAHVGYLKTGFLPYLTNDLIHKGLPHLNVSAGKGYARPVGILSILHQHHVAVADHAHIGQYAGFFSCHVGYLVIFIASVQAALPIKLLYAGGFVFHIFINVVRI